MADQKVSDLPSLNGADVDAADLLYIVDSSAGTAGSKKITIGQYQLAPVSGGTANGVLYLNASKVLTSGSALTFDGTNFATTGTVTATKLVPTGNVTAGNGMYLPAANTLAWSTNGAEGMRLDSSGNLGLGVTPSAWGGSGKNIQLASGGSITSNGATGYFSNTYYDGTNYRYIGSSAAGGYVQNTNQHLWYTAPSGTAGNAISFTQAMTLDASGNLGVGTTSPDARLTLNGASNSRINMRGGDVRYGTLFADSGVFAVSSITSIPLVFGTNDTERARITSGGDLLVGTTSPPAYGSKLRVEGGIESFSSQFNVSSGTSTPFELVNRSASAGFDFYVNSGGTLAARITSGGALLVGTATDAASDSNSIIVNPSTKQIAVQHATGTTSSTNYINFLYASSAIGSITQSGTTAVLYNTTSDQRLKTNIVDAPDAAALIDSIQVRSFDWIADGSHQRYGMVAQELAEVAPEAVHAPADPDEMMAVDYSKLVPMLIKEIQSLRARVAALEAA